MRATQCRTIEIGHLYLITLLLMQRSIVARHYQRFPFILPRRAPYKREHKALITNLASSRKEIQPVLRSMQQAHLLSLLRNCARLAAEYRKIPTSLLAFALRPRRCFGYTEMYFACAVNNSGSCGIGDGSRKQELGDAFRLYVCLKSFDARGCRRLGHVPLT